MANTISQFELTDGLNPAAASDMIAGLHTTSVVAGRDLELNGGNAAMLVVKGRFTVSMDADDDTSGRTVTFAEAGDLLVVPPEGWSDGSPRFHCRALSDSIVVPVDHARFSEWLSDPVLAGNIVRHLASQVADRSLAAATALEPRVERRVLLKVRQLAHRYGRATPQGLRLDLKLTHQQLADMVGAVRESVTIALGKLHAQGDLRIENRTIWLPYGDETLETSSVS